MSAEPVTCERLQHPDAGDLAAINALEQDSFSAPWPPAALAEMLTSEVTRLYVARDADGDIVAFCACWLLGDELHINTIAVKVAVRRQGIATRLLEYILDHTAARSATLEVRRSNEAARKLYEKMGFATTAVRPRYYSHPEEDGLILWLHP